MVVTWSVAFRRVRSKSGRAVDAGITVFLESGTKPRLADATGDVAWELKSN
jgi:hypothetical protein